MTGGLLYPYQQFKLSKYLTDRTYFGDLKFEQNGHWAGLFAYWVWLYIVLGMMALSIWGLAADPGNPATTVIAYVIIFVGYIAFFLMFMRYDVVVFRYLWSNRKLGDATFHNDVTPGKIISIYVVGTLLVGLCSGVIAVGLFMAVGVAAALFFGVQGASQLGDLETRMSETMSSGDLMHTLPPVVLLAVTAYIALFAVPFAFAQIFITRPILQRKAEAMVINEAQALTQSRQRAHDHAAEAGGFADALGVDVGAGI
jgi:uncharacterized membrane protein YjgN (DUF898 family)